MDNIYTWSEDMYPLVKKAFETRYASRMNAISKVCGIVVQDNLSYDVPGLGGYGELSEYNSTLDRASGDKVFTKTIVPKERALAIPVKYKDANQDIVTLANRTGIRLADSAFMTVLNDFFRVFGGVYTSADCPDGESWASNDHLVSTDADSSTYSNMINDKLSVSAITSAIAHASEFVTADGLPFVGNFDMLFVSPDLEETARNICGKDTAVSPTSHPETGLGANPLYGMNYMVVGAGELGFGEGQWAIADSNLLSEIFKLVYVTEPTVLISATENPLLTDFVAYVDYAFGFSDARPIIFSDGTASANIDENNGSVGGGT